MFILAIDVELDPEDYLCCIFIKIKSHLSDPELQQTCHPSYQQYANISSLEEIQNSNSARIATFLTEIADINVEFVHTPGQNMNYSEYSSRHAAICSEKTELCSIEYSIINTKITRIEYLIKE